MESNKPLSLQQMLEQMSTNQLDEMLVRELHETNVNAESIRLILDVLYQREKDNPVPLTPEIEAAWKKYLQDTAALAKQRKRRKLLLRRITGIASTAAVVSIIVLGVLPQYTQADNFWGSMARWSTEFVEFFSPDDNSHRISEYSFSTNHPGLQEIYLTAEEYGAGKHAVPMWVPETMPLSECKASEIDGNTRIYARLFDDVHSISLFINLYHEPLLHKYEKDETEIIEWQTHGTTFKIIQNSDFRTILWNPAEEIECTLITDCQEDVLKKILTSLFTSEVNE
ncbi:MAG: hypothetical protein IJN67_14725 [Oscillospiraceae bacterium]|nr:hypothetical protein [Oscillospiraceae bacterium]